jgi:hypothetical protein
MLRHPWMTFVIACLAPACASEVPAPVAATPVSVQPAGAATASPVSPAAARDVCKRVMLATRACGDLYVPALVRTRARFDQPPGIAARFKAEGEQRLVSLAREEFKGDWADPAIEAHCQKLADMPDERRSAVVERERACLPAAGDCAAFVECNMKNLERKWSAPAHPATPTR